MSDVLCSVRGRVGRLTLNRPKAINALSHDMVRAMDAALRAWEHDDAVDSVLVDGAGARGLCAGGDIRAFHADACSGGTGSLAFWADEYRLNARISRYPKPYVALMDGLVMGGGVGISAHGDVRVVTERTRLGMPEVGIGLVPDVGGTWLLSRMPGRSGIHAALTAAHLTGADALHAGLADHLVPSDRLPDLAEALIGASDASSPTKIIEEFAVTPPASELATAAGWIDDCYRAPTVEEIITRLRAHGAPGAAAAADAIEAKSPTALKVTLRALRAAADLPDLWSALVAEFRVSSAALRSPDLREGIRAQIIDKDRAPRWDPPTLAGVDDDLVAAFFAVPPGGDLTPAPG